MAKRFKLRLSLPNFQLCRSTKNSSSNFCFSPSNPRARDITFPTGPPTSPSHDHSFDSRAPEDPKKHKVIKTLKSFSSFGSNLSFNSRDYGGGDEKETWDSSFDASCDFGVGKGKVDDVAVEEGEVVVKNSDDPYEDFKKSMLEMILQKQMFEVDDLERLLQSYLSLNSPEYHTTIVKAFTEIWEVLFSDAK